MYEKEIKIPEGLTTDISGMKVVVGDQKAKLAREFKGMFGIKIERTADGIRVSSESEIRKQKSKVGTVVAHIRNMVRGLTEGYTARLKIIYTHFPVTVKVDDGERKVMITNFLGEKTPRAAKIFGDDTKVEINGADITVTGSDIEAVGQTAANLEQVTRVRAHDRKVFQDGVYITEKPKGVV
ncbi:MAG: 50S ribosomal protein L6 [Candidatus Aenigmatarchaeota archaeon]